MISVTGVSKSYNNQTVVDGVSCDIKEGGITSIIGPNGAGKSTLLSMIARLLRMDSGSVLVDGLDVTGTGGRELARKMAILRQDNQLTVRLTVRDLVGFGRYPHNGGRPTPADRVLVDEALATWTSQRWRTGLWTSSPAASASVPSLPWCWRRAPTTCCWTSR